MPTAVTKILPFLELKDLPQDRLNQLSSIRGNLVKARNSARLSPSKIELLRKTLEYILQSLLEHVEQPGTVPYTTPLPVAEKSGTDAHTKRRATAKVDKASV